MKRSRVFGVLSAVAVCGLLAACGLFSTDDVTDIVVVVNGLQFTRTIPGELVDLFGTSLSFSGDRDDYLKPALEAGLGDGFEVRTFNWSGDATRTADILVAEGDASLRAFLRAAYAEAKARDAKFIVVAHSWGSLLAYLALALESGGDDPVVCDLYVSLSCPLAANHAGSVIDPLDAAVEAYANAWLDDLGFDIDGALYPRAGRFLNYWAWGDCISGPLSARIPAAAGVQDLQIDIFGVADATSLKRGIDDVLFWHLFTSLKEETLAETDYADSEGFGGDLSSLFAAFRADIYREVDQAGSDPAPAEKRLQLKVDSVQCVGQPEYSPNSEYFGYFRIKKDGDTVAARKWYEDGDVLSAWLEQDETRGVGWAREITVQPGEAAKIELDAVLYEDDVGGDGAPGKGSASFSYDGESWDLGATSGSFDCAWSDGDGEYNTLRVAWSASLED